MPGGCFQNSYQQMLQKKGHKYLKGEEKDVVLLSKLKRLHDISRMHFSFHDYM